MAKVRMKPSEITATSSILALLRTFCRVQYPNGTVLRRGTTGSRYRLLIVTDRYNKSTNFPFTTDGLSDALELVGQLADGKLIDGS